jgi:hypothetical protein
MFGGALGGCLFHEGEEMDEEALKTLVRAAVTLNKSTVDLILDGLEPMGYR